MRLASVFELPLLTKELVERAARRRTYWLRVLFALALYICFWSDNHYRFRALERQALGALGIGDDLFASLTALLFFGIYIFVPATMCGVITHEKERDSLVLLLLTPLKPWRIVLQKYLGGLIPSLTILIIALPLGAVCYTFGGFTSGQLAWTVAILLLAILQIGALAVWCSALCRTSGAAFITTYALAGALVLLPLLIAAADYEFKLKLLGNYGRRLIWCHVPPAVWDFSSSKGPAPLVGCGIIATTTVAFLLLATYYLPRRAFAPPKAVLRHFFTKLDRVVERLNRIIGGLAFKTRSNGLPGMEPILWRESRARAVARPEYLMRILVALLVPVVGLVAWAALKSRMGTQSELFPIIAACFGTVCVLVLGVMASNCIINERVNQTFEVLMTTPLSAKRIVTEKARALFPLLIVLALPLLVIFAGEAWVESDSLQWFIFGDTTTRYLLCCIGTVFLQLSLVVWLSLWIGMWCRTRLRALGTTLGAIIGWCGLPLVALAALDINSASDPAVLLFLLSPLTVPALNEFDELDQIGNLEPLTLILINFALYAGIVIWLRHHCLTRADAYLRR